MEKSKIEEGLKIIDLLAEKNIIQTKSEGRRMIQQSGIYLNDQTVESHEYLISMNDFTDGFAMIRKGKKKYYKVELI